MIKKIEMKKSQLKFVAAAILTFLFLSGWLLHANFLRVSEQERWVVHTMEVISELDLTISASKDAETGVRGYLLTNDKEFLKPYETGILESSQHLGRVRYLTQDDDVQQKLIAGVELTLQKRLDILNTMVSRVQSDSRTKTEIESFIDKGKVTMDKLRFEIDAMKDNENALLTTRTQSANQSKLIFVAVLILTILFMAFAITFAFWQIARNQKQNLKIAFEKAEDVQKKLMVTEIARALAGDFSMQESGSRALRYISEQLNVLAGKIWIFENNKLEIGATYGIGAEGEESKSDQTSLVRASLERRQIWQVHNIPETYWHVSSGFGESIPKELTFIPFEFQGRQIGVVELATFESLSEKTLNHLAEMAPSIGIGINAAQSKARLHTLLEKTQQQSEELQAQQEELRTSNEELEQQARALEAQQQSMNIKNRELEVTQAELEIKASDLQKSSVYKSEFLAKMSHELRTPLNGLLILSTLLVENKEKNLTEQQKQFAQSIKSAGNDLLTLINDILDLSKIEARKLSLRPEDFTLDQLLTSTGHSFKPQTDAKKLQFVIDVPEEIKHLKLHTDRQRIDQILRNFLSNAVKFTDTGSIKLIARASGNNQRVILSVADSGIGVASNKQKAIFEAFEQADGSVSRQYGGTGLGLTISRELAALLGGQIDLQSVEGEGSTFSLDIPVRLGQSNSESAQAEKSADHFENRPVLSSKKKTDEPTVDTQTRKSLSNVDPLKKSILIVEDDANFRLSVVEAVKSYGFNAVEAADGEIALSILQSFTPDAILLDIKLPGISGLGILEMIKQLPHLRHIPVHMISGLDYQHNALRMGAFGYLTKPVTIEKVRSALDRIENQISKKLRRVLLIEDDRRQSDAVAQLIGGEDLEVVSALTGKSAVEHLKADGFDCIILDLTLPDVSGFDLLSELRSLEISLPPVVIYTGKDLSDKEESYLRKFSDSIVIKGARSPERLLDEVNLFLHRVESLLPETKRAMLSNLRSQEKTFEGKTVLVVDDDIRNIFALTSALEAKGLTVRTARDGIEALESLEKNSDISIVLMDIMMPRMNGFEAMKAIREHKNPQIKSLPIVAVTAKAMKEDHEKCMDAGASDYLPKPINLENLNTILKVWLAPKGYLS